MMICQKCHQEIPDGKYQPLLLCADCLARTSREAYLEHQKQYLPGVLEGVHPLTLRKQANQTAWHVVLLGDPHHAWCGATVAPQWKRRSVRFPEQRLADVCRECRAVFDRLVKELPREVA